MDAVDRLVARIRVLVFGDHAPVMVLPSTARPFRPWFEGVAGRRRP